MIIYTMSRNSFILFEVCVIVRYI